MVDVKCLSDYELQNELHKLGFSPGPILELNAIVVLKGNIILSSEKSKGPKKRPKASTAKPKAQDTYCLGHKRSEKKRWASRAPCVRFKGWSNTEGKDCCTINWSVGSRDLERFPAGLKLAVFVIFIIVLFVYITVEKKPLFG
ncbi:LEM domain-containing protein 1 isoform X2 [Pteronotus mesoamericanus]|uniref:LEM domain-containing protein 1 isoform X2 n=1 Tax=Pteronotus mesoamericanus TaxID=1884717 RepID=UPI0023EC35E4|nr:LEM domain-containing protein 1 isoform X2 [Pteronotus parnellii mesoamericanus]